MPPLTKTRQEQLTSSGTSITNLYLPPLEKPGADFNTARKPWAHFLAGGAGGMAAALVTSPLDVLKTRLQTDFYQSQLATFRSPQPMQACKAISILRASVFHLGETVGILMSIPRTEGWRALFKGLGPTLSGIVPASAIKFYAYSNSKRFISDKMNHGREAAWVHLLAAATAGVTVSTATNPIWVIRTRLQLSKLSSEGIEARGYRRSLDCALQIIRNEGFKGLYRGLSASYLGVTESALQWVLYERMKTILATRKHRNSQGTDINSFLADTID